MSATFNPSLSTDRDFVRQLIGDNVVSLAQLQDETIDAVLVEVLTHGASAAGAKYCAAAQLGEMLLARWQASGQGVTEKAVSKLRIKYADGQGSAAAAYVDYLLGLKQQCTHLSLSQPAILKAW